MGSESNMDWQLVLVAAVSAMMIIGAVIDGWKLKVPNKLTFPMILGGWAFWTIAAFFGAGWSAVGASIGGTFVAGLLLIPFWLVGGMGAGDVKLYAGFGAWMVPVSWFGYYHLFWAFAISVVVGATMGILRSLWERTYMINIENSKDILRDWLTSGSLEEVRSRAKERKPSLQLIPYGIPLTIGSLGYVAYLLGATIPTISAIAMITS